ncbi:beta-amylase [Sarracenia purpurea var. burkii]
MSSFSDDRQSGELTKQARRRSVNQTNQKVQKHSAIQTHHQIQTKTIFGIERPLKKIRENQQHIENYRLHRVEPHVPAEIRVSDDDEVQGKE